MAPKRTVREYAMLKTLDCQPNNVTLQCVYCRNLHPNTGIQNPLTCYDPTVKDSEADVHKAHVLPCGHFMGKSCIEMASDDRCKTCHVLFRRNPRKGCCGHTISLPRLNVNQLLSPIQEQCLLPTIHRAYVPSHCRSCATMRKLRQLTHAAREDMRAESGPNLENQRGDCIYATNGEMNGFLAHDHLEPFKELNISVTYPILSPDVIRMARKFAENIRANYDNVTPPIESRGVINNVFVFKVAGYTQQWWLLQHPEGGEEEEEEEEREVV